jgi:dihydroneopterin aldolase
MDQIIIQDLEVFYRVGVPNAEREKPQRLSLTVTMDHDFQTAAAADAIEHTVDYQAVARRLLDFGKDRSWKLIETLAVQLAETILAEFKPRRVTIEIKKFVLREARSVGVRVTRPA